MSNSKKNVSPSRKTGGASIREGASIQINTVFGCTLAVQSYV